MQVLETVAARVLREFAEEHDDEFPTGWHCQPESTAPSCCSKGMTAEPTRGLVHGLPGTGKSRVIKWMRKFFEEALGWEHGVQFVCVAFQNRMAAAIGGTTLHTAAELPRPGEDLSRKLAHSDIDNLYIQNAQLRWVIIDEISMVADELLGAFEYEFTQAARQTRYSKRKDKLHRIFGGYNLMLFGDW